MSIVSGCNHLNYHLGSKHIDIVCPLSQEKNISVSSCPYLLTSIDRGTRWINVYPVSKMIASVEAKAYIETHFTSSQTEYSFLNSIVFKVIEHYWLSEIEDNITHRLIGILTWGQYHLQANGSTKWAHRTNNPRRNYGYQHSPSSLFVIYPNESDYLI